MVYERATGVGAEIIHDYDTVFVNGMNIFDCGAIVERFTVSGTKLSTQQYKGIDRSNFTLLKQTHGMKAITLSLVLFGDNRREITLQKSRLDAAMTGKIELFMPDGFYYSAYMETAGDLTIIGRNGSQVLGECKYTFSGIQHDKLVTHEGNTVLCLSTAPRTDCRLTCTASQNRASLQIGPVTVTDVTEGDVIVADGILGRILQNGAPCAGNMSFMHFPFLVPGLNTITCPEDLTVEYYPTYL